MELNEVWKYYTKLCEQSNETVSDSFISTRASFKVKIEHLVKDVYEFHVIKKDYVKITVLAPAEFSHIPIAKLLEQDDNYDNKCRTPSYKARDDIFLSMIHVALKLRGDILSHTPYKGLKVSKDESISRIPDSLYMCFMVGKMYMQKIWMIWIQRKGREG